MQYSFGQLLDMLLSLLEAAPACSSREESFEQLRSLWLQTHTYFSAPDTELRRIASRRLAESHGWKDLEGDPCHLDHDPGNGNALRIYLHRDGGMVIQRLQGDGGQILFSRLGMQLQPAS
ncbi:Uncharacterised protein [Delftia tsuruhatensis]|uniref:hypothetical protein n=1 Tax=Delftia tsuruhatensis TaxID=180282 RepID=UPI001E7FE2F6|nr:hypothetical protein [Delftia tsuruhatensis]CAB5722350.1 Uncharacterised protein [Delftia tsuruhatensis]CAC9682329.1 Uncharacterised protein [Delftia tsuruhatensis]